MKGRWYSCWSSHCVWTTWATWIRCEVRKLFQNGVDLLATNPLVGWKNSENNKKSSDHSIIRIFIHVSTKRGDFHQEMNGVLYRELYPQVPSYQLDDPKFQVAPDGRANAPEALETAVMGGRQDFSELSFGATVEDLIAVDPAVESVESLGRQDGKEKTLKLDFLCRSRIREHRFNVFVVDLRKLD